MRACRVNHHLLLHGTHLKAPHGCAVSVQIYTGLAAHSY